MMFAKIPVECGKWKQIKIVTLNDLCVHVKGGKWFFSIKECVISKINYFTCDGIINYGVS